MNVHRLISTSEKSSRLNACKGNGFTMASSEAACKAKGGAFVKG